MILIIVFKFFQISGWHQYGSRVAFVNRYAGLAIDSVGGTNLLDVAHFLIPVQKRSFGWVEIGPLLCKLNLSFQSLHDRTDILLHYTTVSVPIRHQLKPIVNFFEGLENLFPATKNLDPNLPGEFIVILIKYLMLLEDPILQPILLYKIPHYLVGIFEVELYLFVSERHTSRSSGVPVHVSRNLVI